jgi:DNA-binding NarL/FixJ family response regulator
VIRVLIVDDQPLIRDALRGILSHQDDVEVVAEATDGAAATRLATDVDVVLMDIRMPGTDGIEATRAIMATPDPPRVLILTTFDLDEYVHACLRAGASGFLLKDSEPSTIVAAIRSAAAGDAVLAPSVTRRLISTYVGTPAPDTALPGALTQREIDVLRAMAQGLSNVEVARALFLGETTVKTHVTSILAKLGVRDRLQAVIRAYETGLVRPGNS